MQKSQTDINHQVNRTSKLQGSSSQTLFHITQHQLRKQSDTLRKQLFLLIDQLSNLLQQHPNYNHLMSKLQHANFLLSNKNTQELINTIKQLEYILREYLDDHQQDLNQAKQDVYQSHKHIQTLQINSNQMKAQYNHSLASILQKKPQFQNLQHQLQTLNHQYFTKRQELLHVQTQRQSSERQKHKQLSQNWSQQTSYIKDLIQQRQQTHNQLQRIKTVFEQLKSKLEDLQAIKQQYLKALEENQAIFEENIKLNEKIKIQETRKQQLLQTKRKAVLSREIELAGVIAQNWNQPQQASQELLFEIINEINTRLPDTELINIQQIIKSAEEYFKNKSRLIKVQNSPNQQPVDQEI